MKWNFTGFYQWPAGKGHLDMFQGFDVFRASESQFLPRDVCEGCVCWRVFGWCCQVQVEAWDLDRQFRTEENEAELPGGCLVWRNCCPVLFFDFIGVKLPDLNAEVKDARA